MLLIRQTTDIKINLYTSGYVPLDIKKPWRYKSARDFVAACENALDKHKRGPIKLFSAYNCCAVDNPDEKLIGHWGENYFTLKNMVESSLCADILRRVKNSLSDLESLPSELNILFVCRSGKHRSLAMAKLTFFALLAQGFNVGSPIHLAASSWQKLCCTCYHCGERSAGLKNALRQNACAIYQNS